MKLAAGGMLISGVGMFGVIQLYSDDLEQLQKGRGQQKAGKDNNGGGGGSVKLDGPPFGAGNGTLVVDGVEQVATGNNTIPYFPRTIQLPRSLDASPTGQRAGEEVKDDLGGQVEYQLLGLGIRAVSFLGIQVYVVGLYIAQSDIAALQHRLITQGASLSISSKTSDGMVAATSLVPGERATLQQHLLDPEQGEEIWARILKEGGIRTAIRIVPTRNTDFLHLRDGWVRAVTGRAQKADARVRELAAKQEGPPAVPEFSDDSFGTSMNEFKALLGGGVRKNVPKGQTLLLLRDKVGGLDLLYQPGDRKPIVWLGQVRDERLSRLLWMAYLAGKNVASEGARKSIVEGVMAIMERPIGTVEQQVV
jgi:hypothetical protein